jgi:hypothetical protein
VTQATHVDPPDHPQKGLRIFTLLKEEHGEHVHPLDRWCLGTCHTVARVNRRSFYLYADGHTTRRLRVEWRQWLAQLQADRWAWLLWSEESPGGWQPLRPPPPDPLAMNHTWRMAEGGLNRHALDQRRQRAVDQVLGHYRLDRQEDGERIVFTLEGGDRTYRVIARPDWAVPPRCDCPDATRRADLHGGFCKHVIAVLLRWPDLRGQLLDALL